MDFRDYAKMAEERGAILEQMRYEEAVEIIERLRDALLWYANKEYYETGQDTPDILIDGGQVARSALSGG